MLRQAHLPALTPRYRTGADRLLGKEFEGLAIDATTKRGTVCVRDLTTTANNIYNATLNEWLTNSGTSPKLVRNDAGTLEWSAHNLVLNSQVAASYLENVESSANATTAPDGTTTADSLIQDSTTNWHRLGIDNGVTSFTNGQVYTTSVWLKDITQGFAQIMLTTNGSCFDNQSYANFDIGTGVLGTVGTSATATITDAGDGWYRCTCTATATGTGTVYGFLVALIQSSTAVRNESYAGDGTSSLYAWGWQLNRGTVPTEYLATTTAVRYGIPQEYDSSASQWGILVEPAATNLALQASDFTSASWTKSTMTTAKTSVGPDGVANSATRLTASGANATAKQAITSASALRISSVYLKRITGSGNIDITHDDGTTWTTVAVTSSWARYSNPSTTAANPTVGVRIVTDTDAVDVALFQHETGAVATSPIPTFGATVTRAADRPNVATSLFPWSDTNDTAYISYKPRSIQTGLRYAWEAYKDINNRISLYETVADPIMSNYQAASQDVVTDLGTLVAGTKTQITIAAKANDFDGSKDGAAPTADSTATLTTGYTTLYLGCKGSATTEELNGYIYKFAIVPYQRETVNSDLATWKYVA